MTDGTRHFVVGKESAGTRLDIFLSSSVGLPRNQIQHALHDGLVVVNGVKKSAHYPVRENDDVTLVELELARKPVEIVHEPAIIMEEKNFLVIDKPAGLLVHPVGEKSEPALTGWLVRHDPNIAAVGDAQRPGIVHRLDRNVSGLMVVARTQEMLDALSKQFRQHQILKIYTALVYGSPKSEEGTLTFRIGRSKHHGRMAARAATGEGKDATTTYDVLQRFATTTLLSVRIFTGRTHQIRAHLFAAGFPVVGDQLYRVQRKVNVPPLDRIFLHATKLGFTDLAGKWQEFERPLPKELQKYLATQIKEL